MLDKIVGSNKSQSIRCFVGVLVGFKTLPDGKEAVLAKELVKIDANGNRVEGDIYTITQGEIDNAEIAAKRNTVETFKNPLSKHFLEPGSIMAFERGQINRSTKTVSAAYIKDLVKLSPAEERTIFMGLVKPLPVARESKSGTASVEVIMPEFKTASKTLAEFDKAVMGAWQKTMQQMSVNGITDTGRPAVIITDSHNSKPVTITISSIPVQVGSDFVYRAPDVKEFCEQIGENKILKNIRTELHNNPNKHTLYVMPGLRLLVPAAKAEEKSYSQTALKEFSGTFKLKNSDQQVKEFESLGYKQSVLSLWKGTVGTISPISYELPRLTDLESTAAIPKSQTKKASLSESKNRSSEASDQAAAAMAAIAAKMGGPEQQQSPTQSIQNNVNQTRAPAVQNSGNSIAGDDEKEFDMDIFDEPNIDPLDRQEFTNQISELDAEEYFNSNLSPTSM